MIAALLKQARRRETAWRYIWNMRPTAAYLFTRKEALSQEAARVRRELQIGGVAVTSVDALLGPDSACGELEGAVEELECERQGDIRAAREAAGKPGAEGKPFTLELLGPRPHLVAGSIFLRFALERPMPEIAHAHFGMFTRLRHWNIWHTVTTDAPPRASQLWHRDYDDIHKILKIFVYLSDVDADSGPFMYAKGSHRLRREPEFLFREGHTGRSSDEQMARLVPPQQWLRCTGPRGTMIFADTHGYHKGGHARARDRVMFTSMWTSPLASDQDLFTRPAGFARETTRALAQLRPAARLALGERGYLAPAGSV